MPDRTRFEIIESPDSSRGLHRSLSRRGSRSVQAQFEFGCVREAHARSDSTATRARLIGLAIVTQEALRRVGELSELEAQLTVRLPHAEPRFRAVADAYAVYAAGQVARGVCE